MNTTIVVARAFRCAQALVRPSALRAAPGTDEEDQDRGDRGAEPDGVEEQHLRDADREAVALGHDRVQGHQVEQAGQVRGHSGGRRRADRGVAEMPGHRGLVGRLAARGRPCAPRTHADRVAQRRHARHQLDQRVHDAVLVTEVGAVEERHDGHAESHAEEQAGDHVGHEDSPRVRGAEQGVQSRNACRARRAPERQDDDFEGHIRSIGATLRPPGRPPRAALPAPRIGARRGTWRSGGGGRAARRPARPGTPAPRASRHPATARERLRGSWAKHDRGPARRVAELVIASPGRSPRPSLGDRSSPVTTRIG